MTIASPEKAGVGGSIPSMAAIDFNDVLAMLITNLFHSVTKTQTDTPELASTPNPLVDRCAPEQIGHDPVIVNAVNQRIYDRNQAAWEDKCESRTKLPSGGCNADHANTAQPSAMLSPSVPGIVKMMEWLSPCEAPPSPLSSMTLLRRFD